MKGEKTLEEVTARRIDAFRDTIASEADEVIFRTFPSKILELHELISSTSSASSPFHLARASSGTDATVYPPPKTEAPPEPDVKKRRLDAGDDLQHARYPNLMTSNAAVDVVEEILKRECEQFVELSDKVRLWINLTMPKIEDGDNFGVQIQEEVLNEIHRSQESAYNMRDSAHQNHLSRAKICSKIIKYPNVKDYGLALKEHDEKEMYFARRNLTELRNIYAVITDVLHKNMTKLRAPKANNSVGLY